MNLKIFCFYIFLLNLISFSYIKLSFARFCNSMNRITNVYSIGKYVYISQGINTIWRYDIKLNSLSDYSQTINDIFGAGIQ